MKILHWDEMFHPNFGYQINLLAKFQSMQGHDVTIMTSSNICQHPTFKGLCDETQLEKEDEEYSKKYNVTIIRLPIKRVISGRVIYKSGYLKKIKNFHPDILMCHTSDTLSSIQIIKHYKYLNVPIIFDNHMLAMASKNPFSKLFRFYYRHFISPILIKNKLITIKTQDDEYLNRYLGLPEELTPFLSFGTDTSLFHKEPSARERFVVENKLSPNDFIVLYTGKLTEAKGGLFLATSIKESFSLTNQRRLVFVIVGNCVGDYGKSVDAVLKESKNKILRFASQVYNQLPYFYQSADLMIFPKQCSLSFFDAQSCGLPVVAEDNNINVERLSHGNGRVFASNDINSFRETIVEFAEMSQRDYDTYRLNSVELIKSSYDFKDLALDYTRLFEKTISDYNESHKR